jgi:hypothetical protein
MKQSRISCKGGKLGADVGGGDPFSACTNFFSKFFAVFVIFFYTIPCSKLGGGVKIFFPESKFFSGQIKEGRKKFFRTNISLVKV